MVAGLTEDDIAPVVDYIVSESYGSYYYDRVRNSFNVMAMERYLKLTIKKKNSDFSEKEKIYKAMQREINSLRIDEQIEEVNTCEWVLQLLLESGAVKLAGKDELVEGLEVVLPKHLRYLRRR